MLPQGVRQGMKAGVWATGAEPPGFTPLVRQRGAAGASAYSPTKNPVANVPLTLVRPSVISRASCA